MESCLHRRANLVGSRWNFVRYGRLHIFRFQFNVPIVNPLSPETVSRANFCDKNVRWILSGPRNSSFSLEHSRSTRFRSCKYKFVFFFYTHRIDEWNKDRFLERKIGFRSIATLKDFCLDIYGSSVEPTPLFSSLLGWVQHNPRSLAYVPYVLDATDVLCPLSNSHPYNFYGSYNISKSCTFLYSDSSKIDKIYFFTIIFPSNVTKNVRILAADLFTNRS